MRKEIESLLDFHKEEQERLLQKQDDMKSKAKYNEGVIHGIEMILRLIDAEEIPVDPSEVYIVSCKSPRMNVNNKMYMIDKKLAETSVKKLQERHPNFDISIDTVKLNHLKLSGLHVDLDFSKRLSSIK